MTGTGSSSAGPWIAPTPNSSNGISTTYGSYIASQPGTPVLLTFTVTATFQPANAQDKAPSKVPILEIANANYSVSGGGPVTWIPDDGMSDTPAYSYPSFNSSTGTSQGKHITVYDGSSGTITISRTLSVKSGGTSVGFGGSASVSYSAQIDTRQRAATISCAAIDTNANGGSVYRDPPLTGPVVTNVRQPDGTLRGDTVSPLGSGSVAYTANVVGAWNPVGTTWHWYSSPVSNASLSGDYPNIQVFNDTYLYGAFVGKTEHIFLSLYDGNDGAEGTGNYYMHFHAHFEPNPWTPDQAPYKVMAADPDAASFTTPPPTYPWQVATDHNGNVAPPLIGPQGGNAVITFGGSKTQGGHVDGALGVAKGDVNAQFGGGYDWSKSSDYSVSINPTPALGINQQTWAVSRLSVNRSKGHLDIYATHGYTGTGLWYKDDIVTTDYNYYQPYAPTNVTPFTPAPGWNPPGYK